MPVQSLPVRDASIHFRLLQQYLVLLKKYPVLTKSVTRSVACTHWSLSGLLMCCSLVPVLLSCFLSLTVKKKKNTDWRSQTIAAKLIWSYCLLHCNQRIHLLAVLVFKCWSQSVSYRPLCLHWPQTALLCHHSGFSQSGSARKTSPNKFMTLIWWCCLIIDMNVACLLHIDRVVFVCPRHFQWRPLSVRKSSVSDFGGKKKGQEWSPGQWDWHSCSFTLCHLWVRLYTETKLMVDMLLMAHLQPQMNVVVFQVFNNYCHW